MLSLISPAKALDFEAAVPKTVHTLPRLLEESTALAAVMKGVHGHRNVLVGGQLISLLVVT